MEDKTQPDGWTVCKTRAAAPSEASNGAEKLIGQRLASSAAGRVAQPEVKMRTCDFTCIAGQAVEVVRGLGQSSAGGLVARVGWMTKGGTVGQGCSQQPLIPLGVLFSRGLPLDLACIRN